MNRRSNALLVAALLAFHLASPASVFASDGDAALPSIQGKAADAPATSNGLPGPKAASNEADDSAAAAAMDRIYAAKDQARLDAAVASADALVESGNMSAAFRLGRYFHIESAHHDYQRALDLYQKAAAAGVARAVNNLGMLFDTGAGVPVDKDKARTYFRQAAELGDYHGFSNLARASFTGNGMPRDETEGFHWLDLGLAKGLSENGYEAATIYYNGYYGVSIDYKKVLRYLLDAAKLGHLEAQWSAAQMYMDGTGMTSDPQKALEMMKDLVAKGFPKALNSMGVYYSQGNGVPLNKETAVDYWHRAADLGYCAADMNLADAYDHGWGVPENRATAAMFNKSAVNCGRPPDGFDVWKLATRYRDATGVPKDCQIAVDLFSKAVQLRYNKAITDLGYLYENGCDQIQPDLKMAFKTYLFGAKMGVALCQNNVGAMLKHGKGVPVADKIRAFAWLSLAAENGSELAKTNLSDYASMFSDAEREAGELHLSELKVLLNQIRRDPRTIMNEDDY